MVISSREKLFSSKITVLIKQLSRSEYNLLNKIFYMLRQLIALIPQVILICYRQKIVLNMHTDTCKVSQGQGT